MVNFYGFNKIDTAYIEQILRLNIKAFEAKCKYAFMGYTRDPKFNRPNYIERPIDLSISPVIYRTVKFNCWGIGHDCIIIDKNNIKYKWYYKTKKLIKI